MTIKTWRNDFLKICKNCNHFVDRGGGRYRYRCDKYNNSIYKCYKCKKLSAVMEQAAEISKQAIDEAFRAFTTGSPMYTVLKI